MPALKDALSNLSNIAQQLNEESDSVNELIATVEGAINQANPGIEVWLDRWEYDRLEPEYYTDPQALKDLRTFWIIGYGSVEGGWRIIARQEEEDINDADAVSRLCDHARPLASCARSLRVGAAPLLERLVERITERAKEMLRNLREAKEKAK